MLPFNITSLESALKLFNTYTGLTAKSVLDAVGVELTQEEVDVQVEARYSFYAKLVKLPAIIIFGRLVYTQCEEIQSYAQQRLIRYLSSGEEQKLTSETGVVLKDTIEERRVTLLKEARMLLELNQKNDRLYQALCEFEKEQAVIWRREVAAQVDTLWKLMDKCPLGLSSDWQARYSMLVRTQAAGVSIPEKVIKTLKLQETLSSTEKALLQLLIEADVIKPDDSSHKSARCIGVNLEEARKVDAALLHVQETLEAKRQAEWGKQLPEHEKLFEVSRNKLLAWRDEVGGLLEQVRKNAFQASPDSLIVNEDLNTRLSLPQTEATLGHAAG